MTRNEAVARSWSQVHIPQTDLTAGGPGSHVASEAQGSALHHNCRSHEEENCAEFKHIPKTTAHAKQIMPKTMHYIIRKDEPSGFSVPTEFCHKLGHL